MRSAQLPYLYPVKKAGFILLVALTLLPSLVSSIPWQKISAELTERVAWNSNGEEEGSMEEGLEDDHLLAKSIQLTISDGMDILHSSRANALRKAGHVEVNAPPPKPDHLI